jgi:predicted Zn-dependent protease
VRTLTRALAWIVVAVVPGAAFAAIAGGAGALVGLAIGLALVLYAWLWLPRAAHAAFEAGNFGPSARRYRVLEAIAPSDARACAARLSRAGCAIAVGKLAIADQLLTAVASDALDAGERAVWLNNRACAALAAGRDPHAALALAEQASALRPDVPALQHTRAMALLAVDRVDDAIAVLDQMRGSDELSPRLEADRCRELARAWAAKGQSAYAEDYRLRAEGIGR